jgi:TrmH family RNA methyltransferase
MLTSLQNPQVKAAVQLHQRKGREAEGQILIEGRHPIEEAVKAGLEILTIYLRDEEQPLSGLVCEQIPVTEAVMAKIATTNTPVPVLAVARAPKFETESVFQAETLFALGITGLQDPANLGSLVRSACAFGVTGIVGVGAHVDPYSPKVIRTSVGLVFRLPILHLADFDALKAQMAELPELTVWGADAHQGASYREVMYPEKSLILLGGEAHGIPEEAWAFAKPLHIPMHSAAESLNVGVAGAIILAEAYQQCRVNQS